MFTKLLPIMFPKAKAECPSKIDLIPKVNSGRLVPTAIIVAPITVCGIPIDSANPTADSTRKNQYQLYLAKLQE